MSKKEILVGSHISSASGLHLAFERAESINCSVMQIFTKSGRSWSGSKISDEEISLFKSCAKKSSIKTVVAHAGYLINIASNKAESLKKSIKSLIDEVHRCEVLGIPFLVLHPGSHLGAGEESGIAQISKSLDLVLESSPGKTMILLENMAGQGTNLGYKFEQLKQMIDGCNPKTRKRLGVCFDTCHAFAAGYDISTPELFNTTIKELDNTIGIDNVKAIHVNDSFGGLGSRKDRHAPLGDGKIPLDAFKYMMNTKELLNIPKILETPSDNEMKLWASEIKLLIKMVT